MSSRVTAAGTGPPRGLWVQRRALTRHEPCQTQAGEGGGVGWSTARRRGGLGAEPSGPGGWRSRKQRPRGEPSLLSPAALPGRLCVKTRPALPQSLCAQITSFFKVPRVIGALKGILRGRAAGRGGNVRRSRQSKPQRAGEQGASAGLGGSGPRERPGPAPQGARSWVGAPEGPGCAP